MKTKLFFAALIFILGNTFVSAQEKETEVDIKDDKVLLEGTAILKYEKINVSEHSFFTLGDDEIISYQYKDNETPKYGDDDYFIINFLAEKVKVESTSLRHVVAGLGMNSRKNMIKMITWLLKEKVLNADGTINSAKLESFSQKYNEDVTQRTVR